MAATTRVPAPQIRQQLLSVLRAWGMSEAHADTTAEMMLETDLRGVDSHGISMLPTYDKEFRSGRLNMRPMYKPLPVGWTVDGNDQTATDAEDAFRYVFERAEGGITPLGGARDVGGHKGYGLAVMVHILGGILAGASFSPIRRLTQGPSDPHNIGHFFMAIDPRAFRPDGEFENDLDQVVDVLHDAKRAEPDQPVLVAGDPEMATRRDRLQHGVPIPEDLMAQLREVAKSAGVPFELAPAGAPAS